MTTVKRGFRVKLDTGKMRIGKNATVTEGTDAEGNRTVTYTTAKGKTLTKTVTATNADGSAATKTRTSKAARAPLAEGATVGKTSVVDAAAKTRTNTIKTGSGRTVVKKWSWAAASTGDPSPE